MGKHDALFRVDKILQQFHCFWPERPAVIPLVHILCFCIVVIEADNHHIIYTVEPDFVSCGTPVEFLDSDFIYYDFIFADSSSVLLPVDPLIELFLKAQITFAVAFAIYRPVVIRLYLQQSYSNLISFESENTFVFCFGILSIFDDKLPEIYACEPLRHIICNGAASAILYFHGISVALSALVENYFLFIVQTVIISVEI